MGPRLAKTFFAAAVALAALAPGASAAVSFQPAQPYAASAPWWSATTDVNGDGRTDVVTASNSTNVISALLGNGDGTLQAPRNTPAAPSNLNAIAAGDLNGDGKGDVAVAVNGAPGTLRVYLSAGDGTFDAGTPYTAGRFPQDVVIAPIDGNSSPDLAVANQGAPGGSVSIYLNNGSGLFTEAAGSPVGFTNQEPLGLGAGDFDGDGKIDLAVGANNGTNPGVFFLKGAGTGAFDPPAPLGGAGAQKAVVGDFNGDGRLDIAAGRAGVGDVVIIKRNATGFDPPASFDPDGPMGSANGRIATADLDGDGVLDLAVPNTVGPQASKVSIGLGHGDATFETTSNEPVGGFPRQVAVGDLNGDGNPDLVTSNSGAGDVSVLLAVPPSVTVPASVAFGDQLLGVTSAERTISVRNDGAPRLRPTAVTLAGADASQFAISSDTCTGTRLAVGATCSVGVKFTPGGAGPRSASVAIASNGAGSPHTVALTGRGLAPGACANRLNGTALADTLIGTIAGDRIFGLKGNDTLNGRGGADCLSGGRGKDKLNGGAGKDKLNGGKGRNTYRAGTGNDTVNAVNRVKDKVDCGAGRDIARVDRNDKVKHCEVVRRAKPRR